MIKPYECKNLPIDIKIDTEMFQLATSAMKKYGEYLGLIGRMEFNKENLLLSFVKMDSYKSTQIEGTNISQTEMFSLEHFNVQSDDIKEILNYSKALDYGKEVVSKRKFELNDINNMHAILLDSVRGGNKKPGTLRTVQNWIGKPNTGIENAIFIPPIPEEVFGLMKNFIEYFNEYDFKIMELIQVAICHAHFESIHPYNDGNGRLGRLLIPLQLAAITNDEPILYISEAIEHFKPAYMNALREYGLGNPEKFIKFFLQCVTDQCTAYIKRINVIEKIIKKDINTIVDNFSTKNAFDVHNIFIKHVALKVDTIVNELGISERTVRTLLNNFIVLGIVSRRKSPNEYIYTELYKVFTDAE